MGMAKSPKERPGDNPCSWQMSHSQFLYILRIDFWTFPSFFFLLCLQNLCLQSIFSRETINCIVNMKKTLPDSDVNMQRKQSVITTCSSSFCPVNIRLSSVCCSALQLKRNGLLLILSKTLLFSLNTVWSMSVI